MGLHQILGQQHQVDYGQPDQGGSARGRRRSPAWVVDPNDHEVDVHLGGSQRCDIRSELVWGPHLLGERLHRLRQEVHYLLHHWQKTEGDLWKTESALPLFHLFWMWGSHRIRLLHHGFRLLLWRPDSEER